ncbi:hypothetical protein [Subtercola boreus]|uniref:hypothetical protein n=1 Tax=Subtercola boreus TaxID=120213 RepID=UPI0011C05CAC|nr:hypothetical protein [Subtercola boreus]
MESELAENYRVRLRSLQWAGALLRELSHSKDVDAVLVAANWALDSVYDLSEGYWMLSGLENLSVSEQDDHLADRSPTAGEKLGGLLVARGKKTHHLTRVSELSPWHDLPYSFANLTDWVWSRAAWPDNDRLGRRTRWYSEHVTGRPLWLAIDEAEYWFMVHSPVVIPPQDARTIEGWVAGLVPKFETEE